MDVGRSKYKALNGSKDNAKVTPRSSRWLNNRTTVYL